MKLDYDSFVKKEVKKLENKPVWVKNKDKGSFCEWNDGEEFAYRYARLPNANPINGWYLFNIVFLNNPKNKKYVKLLIILLDSPTKSVYERCNEYYTLFHAQDKKDFKFYDLQGITSFQYDSKVYQLLQELERRLLVIKKEKSYYINLELFSRKLLYSSNLIGKSHYLDKLTGKKIEDSATPYLHNFLNYESFNLEFVQRLLSLVSEIGIKPWKRLFALKKFNFNAFYLTWLNIIRDIYFFKLSIEQDTFSDEERKKMEKDFIEHSFLSWSMDGTKREIENIEQIKKLNLDNLYDYITFLEKSVANNVEIINSMDTDPALIHSEKISKEIDESLTKL